MKQTKYIFVTGGVVSGLGKGITAASLGRLLKARGYRWNGDGNPNPRAWYVDVDDARREAEISFLRKEIYLRDVELLVHRMDAYNRFSDRQN